MSAKEERPRKEIDRQECNKDGNLDEDSEWPLMSEEVIRNGCDRGKHDKREE